jgi:hypothetical protein
LFYAWWRTKPCPLLCEIWSRLRFAFMKWRWMLFIFFCFLCLICFGWNFLKFLCFHEVWYVLVLVFLLGLFLSQLGRVNPVGSIWPGQRKNSDLPSGFVWMFFYLGLRICLGRPLLIFLDSFYSKKTTNIQKKKSFCVLHISQKYKKSYCLVFPYENSKIHICMHFGI